MSINLNSIRNYKRKNGKVEKEKNKVAWIKQGEKKMFGSLHNFCVPEIPDKEPLKKSFCCYSNIDAQKML